MPKIVRPMLQEQGLPAVGTETNMLGARVPPHAYPDIFPVSAEPDGAQMVHPKSGGISVARSFKDLLPHLIPPRLRPFAPDASGNRNLFIWSTGGGDFVEGAVSDRLYLSGKPERKDGKVLGLVEPNAEMQIEEYQSALAETRSAWTLDEPK